MVNVSVSSSTDAFGPPIAEATTGTLPEAIDAVRMLLDKFRAEHGSLGAVLVTIQAEVDL